MPKCQICNKKMLEVYDNTEIFKQVFQDYVCRQDSHSYAERISKSTSKIIIRKIRIKDGRKYLYLKIYYDENKTEIWDSNSFEKFEINNIVEITSYDKTVLLNKIKTLYLFS